AARTAGSTWSPGLAYRARLVLRTEKPARAPGAAPARARRIAHSEDMSHERPAPSPRPGPGTEFGFTEREQLFDRVSHDRLISFLDDETAAVHRVQASSNSYGEFLFVPVSRAGATRELCVTFFGLGFHEHRGRWVIDEWYWY